MKTEQNTTYTTIWHSIPVKIYLTGKNAQIDLVDDDGQAPRSLRNIHTHFTYEILFVTEGSMALVSELGTRHFQNRVVFVPPQVRHCSFPSTTGSYCMLFSLEEAGVGNQELIQSITGELSNKICDLPLTEEVSFYVRQFAKSDMAGLVGDAAHLLGLIFGAVFRQLVRVESARDPKHTDSRHINEIEEYINTHLFEKITLSQLAQTFFLSTKQISRILQREYRCTLSALLSRKRMDVVETLLKSSDLSVSQIAEQVYAGSEPYFYTLFKKKYHMTPHRYRKLNRR